MTDAEAAQLFLNIFFSGSIIGLTVGLLLAFFGKR